MQPVKGKCPCKLSEVCVKRESEGKLTCQQLFKLIGVLGFYQKYTIFHFWWDELLELHYVIPSF